MDDQSDEELLKELGVSVEPSKAGSRSPREERIIAGFEEIVKFTEEHGRPPQHGDDRDIFERLYAVRLDRLREQAECRDVLAGLDTHGLLSGEPIEISMADDIDDDELLAELGVEAVDQNDLTNLKHVKSRAEVRAAEEIANRIVCADFEKFKPLFLQVQKDIKSGVRETREFGKNADIVVGEFFILGGQMTYVAQVGELFVTDYDRKDRRLRVIYNNGTESDILLRSFQRALYKDEAGRRITSPIAGPLFANEANDEDTESGTIYVLRSLSDHPTVAANRDVIHKIGVTGGKVDTRIANAKTDATYLLADVEIIATYELFNINRTRLENLIHRFFSPTRLELEIMDRFGQPVKPREWFLVPLSAIDDAVAKIRDGTITDFDYDPAKAALVAR